MIILALTSMMAAASLQTAAADSSRKEFVACLRTAVEQAKAQKIAGDGFAAFAHQQCATIEGSFKSAMVTFDVKNKVAKKQAETDAQGAIDDYVLSATDHYHASLPQ